MAKVRTYTAYRQDGNGKLWFHDGRSVVDKVQPGLYGVHNDPLQGLYLKPEGLEGLDDIVQLPNPAAEKTLKYAKNFIAGTYDEDLEELGLVKKMALMLWGEPGTSKTVTAYQIVQYACAQGWICINGKTRHGWLVDALKRIRSIEPDRGILIWWEEFDDYVDDYESDVLQLLDGSDQVSNAIYLMSTNYIDEIPDRIWMRCRRLPFQVEFKFPGEAERRTYFEAKIPARYRDTVDIEEWVTKSDGFSLDQCTQVIQAVFAWGQTIDDVVDDLQQRRAAKGGEVDESFEDED